MFGTDKNTYLLIICSGSVRLCAFVCTSFDFPNTLSGIIYNRLCLNSLCLLSDFYMYLLRLTYSLTTGIDVDFSTINMCRLLEDKTRR